MPANRRAESDTPRASESGRLSPGSDSPKRSPAAGKEPASQASWWQDLWVSLLATGLLCGAFGLLTAASFTFGVHQVGVMLTVAFIFAFAPLLDAVPLVRRICGTMPVGATYTCWNCLLLGYTVLDRLLLGRPPLLLPCLVVNSWAIVASFNVVRLFDSSLYSRAAEWTGYGLGAFHVFNQLFHTVPAIVATTWFAYRPDGLCSLGGPAVYGTIVFHFLYAMRTSQSLFLDKVYFECPRSVFGWSSPRGRDHAYQWGRDHERRKNQHAYEMLMQDLKSQIDHATQERSEKTAMRAKKLQAKADAEGDLTDTTKAKDSDQKYHDDLRATCDQKASDFEQRQELRGEEIQAIEKAVEVLKTNVLGKESRLSLLQHLSRRSTALASLRADSSSIAQRKAAEYLQVRAGELQSRVLSVLAGRISEDPFAKVKKMIKDLLVRLMDEANEEAEHKGWCDTELATNEQTRTEKAAAVETLHAEIDALTASIAKLQEDIGELSAQVAFLDKSMAEQTATRADEKASNLATVKDAQEAQTAVAQALTILKEFYAKAGESTALVQKQPAIFDSPYKGMQAENGGVIGMLEVIESDFARLEAETSATEATAQKSYDEFITDSKVDKAAKQKDIEHKTAKKQDESQALISKKSDLDGTQKELDAAMAYYDKLKPSCVDAGTSYDDRVARRKAEIESLQEALRILNGEDLAA